jgi:hypothetical protein
VLRKHAGWLLLIPIIACLVPSVFNRRTPALAGIPFFYWGQLLLVPLAALTTVALLLLQRGGKRDQAGGDRR